MHTGNQARLTGWRSLPVVKSIHSMLVALPGHGKAAQPCRQACVSIACMCHTEVPICDGMPGSMCHVHCMHDMTGCAQLAHAVMTNGSHWAARQHLWKHTQVVQDDACHASSRQTHLKPDEPLSQGFHSRAEEVCISSDQQDDPLDLVLPSVCRELVHGLRHTAAHGLCHTAATTCCCNKRLRVHSSRSFELQISSSWTLLPAWQQ
jgi:hypothetical protein